jgi:hypothetical protein
MRSFPSLGEELQLVAEEEPGGEKKEEWINEAIQLFGEDQRRLVLKD